MTRFFISRHLNAVSRSIAFLQLAFTRCGIGRDLWPARGNNFPLTMEQGYTRAHDSDKREALSEGIGDNGCP